MQILPKIRIKRGEGVGNEVLISFPDLESNYTFLTSDYASGVSAFAVDNGLKFSTDEYVFIPNVGNEKSEIIKTHASTAPTATTLTMATASSFAHSRGDMVRFIPYNQVVIESSTDNVTFAVLATISIDVASQETRYEHTAGTATTYYKVRFKNSNDTTYSQYSDVVIATGYVAGTLGEVIRKALSDTGTAIDDVITKEFLIDAVDEGRREIDEDKDIFRWSFRTVFDYNAYSIISGQYSFTLPTDLRDADTNKNILSVRIGKDKERVDYCDKIEFDSYFEGVAHTTLNGAVSTSDTEIVLTDSGDFDESGSIDVAGQAIDEEIDNITYGDNTEADNELQECDDIRTAGHADGTDVWQGATFSVPDKFTVDNGVIYFNYPFENDLAGENIYLNYYKKLEKLDSDGDSFDEPFYSIYVPYLRFRIKMKKDEGLDWKNDIDYIKWSNMKKDQIQKEYFGQAMRINIDV